MQNKANFQKVKFYASKEMKKDYEKRTLGGVGKTKPNKANSKPISKTKKHSTEQGWQKGCEILGLTFILLKIEQGLGLNHCHLFGISRKSMDVQLTSPCLEVDIAEWL